MPENTSDLQKLQDPVAQEMLNSTHLARLAYTWHDGTPRVIPVWFHWDGEEIVMGTPVTSPKCSMLRDGAPVAITIDGEQWPYHALTVRGTAHTETVQGVAPEYAKAAERYFGAEQGRVWVGNISQMFTHMFRIAVRPERVSILDFETRFPSAIAAAMSGAQG